MLLMEMLAWIILWLLSLLLLSWKLPAWNGEGKGHNSDLELKGAAWISQIFVTRRGTEGGNTVATTVVGAEDSFTAGMYLYSPNRCVTCLGKLFSVCVIEQFPTRF